MWEVLNGLSWTNGTGADGFYGDWDGDGDDTVGVFRPSTNTWFLRDTFTQASAILIIAVLVSGLSNSARAASAAAPVPLASRGRPAWPPPEEMQLALPGELPQGQAVQLPGASSAARSMRSALMPYAR